MATTLSLGQDSTSSGNYTLEGGTLETGNTQLGLSGTGTFIQGGGTHITDGASLGQEATSHGTYNLGGGILNSKLVAIGASGYGEFLQKGDSSHNVAIGMGIGGAGDPGGKYTLYEHGFQADFANNQDSWSGALGRHVTVIVGLAEYLNPDIDVILSSAWEDIKRIFNVFNAGLTPRKNPAGFNTHEYLNSYIKLMEKYNSGDTDDYYEPTSLALAVVGHTHSARLVQKPKADRTYYLMDCGSWVNGGHEFGVISGKDMAVCQWEEEGVY